MRSWDIRVGVPAVVARALLGCSTALGEAATARRTWRYVLAVGPPMTAAYTLAETRLIRALGKTLLDGAPGHVPVRRVGTIDAVDPIGAPCPVHRVRAPTHAVGIRRKLRILHVPHTSQLIYAEYPKTPRCVSPGLAPIDLIGAPHARDRRKPLQLVAILNLVDVCVPV